jgi:hypothetical protein
MPPIRLSLAAQNVQAYRALSKRLRQGKPDLRKKLRASINEAGKPVLDEVKERIQTLHVSSGHGGGARRRQMFAMVEAGRRAHARGADVRGAALRASKRSTGLRTRIAAATKLQITAKGVRFVVNSSQLPESQRTLPRHLDSPKGWRHPVFGNREVWVDQKGGPWFADTIKRRAPEFRSAIVKAMDDISQEIEG